MIPAIIAIASAIATIAAALVAVAEAAVVTYILFTLILSIFSPTAEHHLQWLVGGLIRGALRAVTPLVRDLSGGLDDIVKTFVGAFNAAGGPMAASLKKPFEDIAREGFDVVAGSLIKRGKVTPDKWLANAADAMADAFGFGLSSFGVTAAFEALTPEKLNTLNGVGPMLATLSGFEEVTKAALGPLLGKAIATPASYDLNNKFRPNLPADRAVQILYSRRIIDSKTAHSLLGFAGYDDKYITEILAGAFRPVSPFVLSRLADGPDWDPAAMRELLRYSGYRDKDIDLLIKAFEAQALRSLRQQYLTAAMSSFENGFSSDKDLQDVLDNLHFNADAQDLIKKIAGLKKSDKVFKEHVDAETFAVNGAAITIGQYRANLTGLGLATETVNALIDHAQAHDAATAASAQRREVETLIRHERQLYIQDWLLAFQSGIVNEVELTAGLALIGLPPAVIVEYVALGELRKKPPKKPPAKKPPGA